MRAASVIAMLLVVIVASLAKADDQPETTHMRVCQFIRMYAGKAMPCASLRTTIHRLPLLSLPKNASVHSISVPVQQTQV